MRTSKTIFLLIAFALCLRAQVVVGGLTATSGAVYDWTAATNFKLVGYQPGTDSTTAITVFKANGTTAIIGIDTTNGKFMMGSAGAVCFSSTAAPAGTCDTGASRGGAANTIKFGNGTANDATGTAIAGVFTNNTQRTAITTGGLQSGSGEVWSFASTAGFGAGDVGFSRTGAGAMACGNGTQGNTGCILTAGGFSTAGNITAGAAAAFRFGTTTSQLVAGATNGDVMAQSNAAASGRFLAQGLISNGTKFTTTGCSVSATTGGASAGTFTLGANTCTVVVTINGATGSTAPNGWACSVDDRTAVTVLVSQSASSATTASFSIPVTAGATDVIQFACTGY